MNFVVTSSPHIRSKNNTNRIMLDVLIALLPALIVGILRFGLGALTVSLVSVIAALTAEWICSKIIFHRNTVADGSAAVTGLLLAMTLPATVPYWIAALGSAFAIIIFKGLCGGLGRNIFNPALAARALLMMLWPSWLILYAAPGAVIPVMGSTVDVVTTATPLHHMQMPALPEVSVLDAFLGKTGGTIGEVCTLALLAGGAYLIYRGVISVRIPGAYLGTVALLSLVFYKGEDPAAWMIYILLSGGVVLGAFFMATDYATSPVTAKGQLIYGIGCGALTVLFRYYGLFPEGVTYAILLMNAFAWAIDVHTAPGCFGWKKGGTA